jgi:plasmid stability protein
MAELHVRNLPPELHEQLRVQAAAEGRSMSAEAISLLRRALNPGGTRAPRSARRSTAAGDPAPQPAARHGAAGRAAGAGGPGTRRVSDVLVIDASVAMKWVVTESGSDQDAALLTELAGGAVSLVAPEHLLGEVGNGLRRRVAQGVLTTADAASLAAPAMARIRRRGGPSGPCRPTRCR